MYYTDEAVNFKSKYHLNIFQTYNKIESTHSNFKAYNQFESQK